jgi:hypothetical protein
MTRPVPMSPSRLERQRADDDRSPCSGSVHVPAKLAGPVNDAPVDGEVIDATGAALGGGGGGGAGVGGGGGGAGGGGGGTTIGRS